MSGLSLAEMRRIGTQRNQEAQTRSTKSGGFLKSIRRPKQPMGAPAQATQATVERTRATAEETTASAVLVDRAEVVPLPQPDPPAEVEAPAVSPTVTAVQPTVDISADDAAKLLPSSLLRHTLVGGLAAGIAGVAGTGSLVGLSAGLVLGGLGGRLIGQNAQSLSVASVKHVQLGPKAMPRMREEMLEIASKLGQEKARLTLSITDNAAVHIASISGGKGMIKASIGIGLLRLMSQSQIVALFAQNFTAARYDEQTGGLDISFDTASKLTTLANNLEKRPALVQLNRPANLYAASASAHQWYQTEALHRAKESDKLATISIARESLADALLTNALIAVTLLEAMKSGQSFDQWLAGVSQRWSSQTRDSALRYLSQHQMPDVQAHNAGIPIDVFNRISALGANCPIPSLPAPQAAWGELEPKVQKAVQKRLLGKGSVLATQGGPLTPPPLAPSDQEYVNEPASVEQSSAAPTVGKSRKGGLLSSILKPRSTKAHSAEGVLQAHAPLYEADELFKEDTVTGIEAYKTLFDANPRWALARLRLGEALVESGYAEGVEHLMASAETLPSALPTILETLSGSLAMVSPLEEEPLRLAIEKLQPLSIGIAQERAGIDLDRLQPPAMDEADQLTLMNLFDNAAGLAEAWVFSLPVASMPNVPHHAILGLAPQLDEESMEKLSTYLVEHAAVHGTVVVHLETDRPTGALEDVFASQSSVWVAPR
ncbi:MAG: hypothetical protein AAF739_13000 [Pseudomonadota bacterium]